VYDRAVNNIPAMEAFRVILMARLRKPDGAQPANRTTPVEGP